MSEIYNFKVKDLFQRDYDLAALKDKVVVVFNTASKCGFTPQLEDFEKLYKKHKDNGLFANQEPGNAEDIIEVCERNYGVTFPVMEKIDVNGDNAHPLFEYLKKEKPGILGLKRIKWNFEKFLIDKQGNVVNRYSSMVKPFDIEPDILKLME
ncbi:hypothetical protein HK103_002799 [Boothiomyces macroporosus]|uniref:Glutathione peroxidase n=1 Tax=Boothiomyces macroporosus TaxID=261099 RepID=A0AAD5UMN7_9FUNG|nr:hypothetical protein HK103_002772 [Boothiomyces macroporosus]KAJ3262383.1 hypothetical protein HK103_002799 [Boothiomyces macroporosus]